VDEMGVFRVDEAVRASPRIRLVQRLLGCRFMTKRSWLSDNGLAETGQRLRLHRATAGWLFVGAAIVSACGSGGSQPTRDPTTIAVPENIAESEFASLVSEIGCHAVAPCCAEVGYQYDSVTCSANFSRTFGLYRPEGRSFDGGLATECLRALQKDAVECGHLPAPCLQVYRGALPLGSSCVDDGQCEAKAEQQVTCDTLGDWTCKVTNKGAEGDPCDQTCQAENERSPGCRNMFLNGNAALPANAHVACDRAIGLACDESTAKCVRLTDVGSSCKNATHCPVGSSCVPNEATSTCEPLATEGKPCANLFDCAGNAYCDAVGTCHPAFTKGDGESCVSPLECVGECAGNQCMGARFATGFSAVVMNAICGRQENL